MAPFLFLALLQTRWQPVAAAFGQPGEIKDSAYVESFYRSDLQVQNASGMLIPPEMGLVSYASFTGPPEASQVQGQACLASFEVDPMIDRLRAAGVEITSLSNRLTGEQPAVYFLKFRAEGEAGRLAKAIKSAFDEMGKERPISEGLQRTGHPPIVDWKSISLILGQSVQEIGASHVMKAQSGVNWVTFGGCPCGRTMLMGEIIADSKRQAVIDALRRGRLRITAILGTSISFEGEGEAERLAATVRAGWDLSTKGRG